jgi:DNA invertase Pin-like site-specific DNA recombinase
MARKSRKHQTNAPVECAALKPSIYNAGAYLRLSRDDTKKGGDSLETQRGIIENFAAINPDIKLTDVYMDNDRTGTNFERPEFRRMLSDVEIGRINCIIVKDLTRFGRNAIDTGYYIEKYFPSMNVRFIAITDCFDSDEGDGGILLPIKNIISESYALDISRKCKAVQRQNIRDGKFVGRMAPYGYVKDTADCHHLTIDLDAEPIVKQIFEWASAGVPVPEIACRLNAADVLSPSHYKKSKGTITSEKLIGNRKWKRDNVGAILTDRVYIGDMAQGKTKTVNRVRVAMPPEEWIIVENTHEPIISRQLFNATAAVLLKNKSNMQRETIPYSGNVFKGKVFCAHCGYAMYRNRTQYGVYRYLCKSRELYSKTSCVPVIIREVDLKSGILTLLRKYEEVIIGKSLELESKELADEKSSGLIDAEIREINRSLGDNGRYLESLYENMVDGIITMDEFTTMKTDYKARIEELSRRADAIREKRFRQSDDLRAFRSFEKSISHSLGNGDLTGDVVDCLIEKIHIGQNKSIDVHFKFEDRFREGCINE